MAASDSPFALPAFRRYWLARIASMAGSQIQIVAVGWQLYDMTHDVLDLGLIGLAQFLPAMLFAIPAGYVVDRFSRQRVLTVAMAAKALWMTLLTIGSWYGSLTPAALFALAVLIGTGRAFEMPAHSAMLSRIVPARLLPHAVAWSSSATQGAVIVAPAVGGFIYAAGPQFAYGISAVLGLIAAVLIGIIRGVRFELTRDPPSLAFVLGGLRFIRSHPVVLGAMSLDMMAVLLGGASAMLPVYARDILHTGAWGVGLLRSAEGIGALIVALALARFPLERRVGRQMFFAVAVFGLATLLFAVSSSFVLSFAALVLLGGADMVSVVIRQSLIQLETPDSMRGRVGAVNSMFIGASNQLGEFRAGGMAALIGVVPAVALGGLGTLAAVGLWRRWFPDLYGRDALQPTLVQDDGPEPR
ncbi:MAG: MFS transporter [Burkholderiaceae bacterium]